MSSWCIFNDEITIEAIKEPSKNKSLGRVQGEGYQTNAGDFDNRMPTEEEFTEQLKYLRTEKKMASSDLWTAYSMINTVVKWKYSQRLQQYLRLTTLLKSFDSDTKKKAPVFETEDSSLFVSIKAYSSHCHIREWRPI